MPAQRAAATWKCWRTGTVLSLLSAFCSATGFEPAGNRPQAAAQADGRLRRPQRVSRQELSATRIIARLSPPFVSSRGRPAAHPVENARRGESRPSAPAGRSAMPALPWLGEMRPDAPSEVAATSCSRRIPMICSFVNRECFICLYLSSGGLYLRPEKFQGARHPSSGSSGSRRRQRFPICWRAETIDANGARRSFTYTSGQSGKEEMRLKSARVRNYRSIKDTGALRLNRRRLSLLGQMKRGSPQFCRLCSASTHRPALQVLRRCETILEASTTTSRQAGSFQPTCQSSRASSNSMTATVPASLPASVGADLRLRAT